MIIQVEVREKLEVGTDEIATEFGKMTAGEQATFLLELEEGLLQACGGDIDKVTTQLVSINKAATGTAFVADPGNFKP